jgi:hypothetical protein
MGEKIIKLIVNIGNGMGQAMVISPDRPYVLPLDKAFQIDNSNLNNDTRKIGRGLNRKIKQYSHDESSYKR